MSGLIGGPGERLHLARMVDVLAAAARQAGRPGWIWLAGLLYPGLKDGLVIVDQLFVLLAHTTGLSVPGSADGLTSLHHELPIDLKVHAGGLVFLLLLFVLLPFFLLRARLNVGLAAISGPASWERARGERRVPRLRESWRSGRGLTRSAFGLWLTTRFLGFGAVLFVLGPIVTLLNLLQVRSWNPIVVLVLLPLGLLLLAYALVLEVLTQLGLHSLARNRRGTGSALTHAWRLVLRNPWPVFRATLMDLVLQVFVTAFYVAAGVTTCCTVGLAVLAAIALEGYAGTVRAAFWARCYRLFGGLSPEDGVPGLVDG